MISLQIKTFRCQRSTAKKPNLRSVMGVLERFSAQARQIHGQQLNARFLVLFSCRCIARYLIQQLGSSFQQLGHPSAARYLIQQLGTSVPHSTAGYLIKQFGASFNSSVPHSAARCLIQQLFTSFSSFVPHSAVWYLIQQLGPH